MSGENPSPDIRSLKPFISLFLKYLPKQWYVL